MAYDNGMCAHVWAQQDKASGKTGNGNMSFEGATLYSYRTPIGRFVETVDGRRAVLVTSNNYSITTSGKHIPALWRAIDYGRGAFSSCFTVPRLGYTFMTGQGFTLSREDHAANLAHLVEAYHAAVAADKRKRDLGSGWQIRLTEAATAAREYAFAFDLPVPELKPETDIRAIEEQRAAREAKANAPGAAEKRERERAARAERKERKEAEQRRLALLAARDKIAAWREGANIYLPHNLARDEQGGALLRVVGKELQTSQGARVPLADAIRVFRFVKLARDMARANGATADSTGVFWERNGRTLPVGAFQVDKVLQNGTFRAGCHLIHWPEIEAAARAAGVLDIAPADTREGEAHA